MYNYYKDNKLKTNNYSVQAVDVFDFTDLNAHVIDVYNILEITKTIFGVESETYKIAYFLTDYFSYYNN